MPFPTTPVHGQVHPDEGLHEIRPGLFIGRQALADEVFGFRPRGTIVVLLEAKVGNRLLSGIRVGVLLVAPRAAEVEPVGWSCARLCGCEGVGGGVVVVEVRRIDGVPETAFVGDVDEGFVVDVAPKD